MKKYLLGKNKRFYKANMHSHTTVSDGKLTPEEVKQGYRKQGYSIVAFTDHNVLVPHPELKDDDFLPITAYEFAIHEGIHKGGLGKAIHMNLYAREETNDVQVCMNSKEYIVPQDKEHLKHIKYIGKDEWIPYCPASINRVIKTANENGFIVCYNHPTWSNETIFDYAQYNGFFAMEVYNHVGSICEKDTVKEWNMEGYDTLLRMGRRIFPIFADDSHRLNEEAGPYCEAFGGFIMVDAPALTYDVVFSAIEKGDFYASQGPEILQLYTEDNKLCVFTSEVKEILFVTAGRCGRRFAAEEGKTVSYGEFEMDREFGFVRIEITDNCGRVATTRGFFEDEIR